MDNISITEEVVTIDSKAQDEVISSITVLLADLHAQYHNVRNFHWHITGPDFYVLHEKFEELYNELLEKTDEAAERILALEGRPGLSPVEYASIANIQDGSKISSPAKMIESVASGNEMLVTDTREILKAAAAADDEGTADIFSGYIASFQKANWMLKAFLG